MAPLLTIGEFSRATHLSVKALRHYDEVGLLSPADVDRASGYRRYALGQVPAAQVIRRFRDLDMPIDLIREVLGAPDRETRDRVIVDHLARMEAKLDQTQATVASLRGLLEGRSSAPAPVEVRNDPASLVLCIRGRVLWDEAEPWLDDALRELQGMAEAEGLESTGPVGALYSEEFFEAHDGEVVAFAPVARMPAGAAGLTGRVVPTSLPGGPVAVMVHRGPFASIDTTYAALGAHVVEHGIGGIGPIRENYLVTADDTDDPSALRTEVCWPVRG
jgi:DNA-binding transcriptional MerR regulator